MLQDLRDKAQGWIAWVIIGLIGITFVLFGTSDYFSRDSSEKVVAKVNGKKITERELEAAYDRAVRQAGNESIRNLDPKAVKKDILQSLIDQSILLEQAHDIGMRVDPVQVNNALASFPFLQEDGQFSKEAYARFLANINYTDAGFRQLLQDSFLREQLQQGIMQTAFALPADVTEAVRLLQQKRNVKTLTFNKDQFEKGLTVSPEEIKTYYDANLKNYMSEEKVSLEYIHVSLKDIQNKYKPTEQDIKKYYDENIAAFSTPERIHVAHILVNVPKDADAETVAKAQKKIKEAQAKLKAGTSFEAVAKEFSEDNGSAGKGGVLEWFSKGEMIPSFEQAAFALKAKEISEPVKTEYGFHIIKYIDKQPAQVQEFKTAEKDVVEKMKQQVAEEQFISAVDQLSSLAFETPDSLQPVADKLDLPIQKSEIFTPKLKPNVAILQNPAVITAAFSHEVKDEKNNSDIIKLDDENYIVVRAADYVPPAQIPLSEVQNDIKVYLVDQKSSELAKNKAEETLAAIKDKPDAMKKLAWQEKNDLSRVDTKVDPDLIDAAFSIPNQTGDDKKPPVKLAKLSNGDYALVWVTKIIEGNTSSLSANEQQGFVASLNKHYGELEYVLYSNALVKKAKIKEY